MPFKLFPQGMDGSELWAPYAAAKQAVEAYPEGPQEPGCQLSLIRYDAESRQLELRLDDLRLPSACPRFASRACPRMESMGHEPLQASCNYWDYPRMVEAAPGIELYPEWQRFDCNRYYPLFQAHLVGVELASRLGAELRIIAARADARMLSVYAGLSSDPKIFSTGD